jgi:hypothetical protein
VLKDFKKWKLTYASYRKSLKNDKAPATVDLEEEDGGKGTPPVDQVATRPPRGDVRRDIDALALSETFKGWMVNKEEAITKKAITVEESLAKAKALEAEAKLLAEERDHVHRHNQHDGGANGLGGEA